MAFPYLEVVIGFNVLTYVFQTYLNVRQYVAHKLPTLPKSLVGVISQEKFEKSQAYSIDKSRFKFVCGFVAIVLDSGILYFKILPWLWQKCGDLSRHAAFNTKDEIWCCHDL
uniref:CAAX prenyl protease 1 N-terminal domain-containing protein n=1 Tax=Opuntia streptacantha TaxID=393608 RepID=A0A7C9DVJ8_OPUST